MISVAQYLHACDGTVVNVDDGAEAARVRVPSAQSSDRVCGDHVDLFVSAVEGEGGDAAGVASPCIQESACGGVEEADRLVRACGGGDGFVVHCADGQMVDRPAVSAQGGPQRG
jgi:hypothetical protein